jgi:rubrerythrin
MDLRKQLEVNKAAAKALAGEVAVEKTVTVRGILEDVAKAKGLSDEQRALMEALAKMDVFKADLEFTVVIENDPWQWPTTEAEVQIGSDSNPSSFPEKTAPIIVKAKDVTVEKSFKCPECGTELEDGTTECPECGAKLDAAGEVKATAEKSDPKKKEPPKKDAKKEPPKKDGKKGDVEKAAVGDWPGDIAAAKYDPASGRFQSSDLSWGRDRG